nr:nuclear receptor coactivator 6-like isoform X2 [Procambarus clarkii]
MNFLSTLEPNVFGFVQKSIYEGLAAFDEQGSVLHMDSYDVSTCGASTTTCGSTITVLPETDSHGEKGTPEPVLDDVEDADQLSHEYMLRRSQTCRYTSSEMTEDEIKEFIIKTFHPFENWTPGMEHEDVEAAGLSSGEVEFHLSCRETEELANCRSESHRNAVDRVKRLKKAYKFAMKCINIYEKMHTQQKTELKELEMQLTRKEQELLEERKKIIKLENKLKMSGQYAMSQPQPPRYPGQQMMGPGTMMRHVTPAGGQMVGQTGQMMSRPPPPEYRQVTLLQQQQQMMGQPMPQPMSQMGQNMGQMSYQGMRPNMRPGMVSGPMVNMGTSQMMGGMTQQTLPPNMPTMKPGMVPTTTMNPTSSMPSSTITGASMPTMSVGTISASNMSNSLGQVSTAGTMGMVSRTPMATGGMLQRPRPPNVNIGPGPGGLNIGTQMPPSRPEWRQIMMQGSQGNMQMIGPMRPGYPQQQPQQVPKQEGTDSSEEEMAQQKSH